MLHDLPYRIFEQARRDRDAIERASAPLRTVQVRSEPASVPYDRLHEKLREEDVLCFRVVLWAIRGRTAAAVPVDACPRWDAMLALAARSTEREKARQFCSRTMSNGRGCSNITLVSPCSTGLDAQPGASSH